mmetsp:Transcript_26848/g.67338  ORF Transcript_26848/g.67338 Transcript_26848/m.67338 type:complete len:326 (-) Transcript_26848:223-1200(-)|eukprot:CAMPEP_0174907676 /NCGR_PEP_ID=MMETSP0167-20121228/61686_1 /TAXON_ID=38298 /ORGANISM="Rhodella maculata, Strain CCMP736" /LENGTH=325 /DNA_ID=CAMNT_0016151209 /DNA_START=142 /DNA_END=1119 /DNA_ORIENTATION=+
MNRRQVSELERTLDPSQSITQTPSNLEKVRPDKNDGLSQMMDNSRKSYPMNQEQRVFEYRMLKTGAVRKGYMLNEAKLSDREKRNFKQLANSAIEQAQAHLTTTSIVSVFMLTITLTVQLVAVPGFPEENLLAHPVAYRAFRFLVLLSSCSSMTSLWFASRWLVLLAGWCVDERDQIFFLSNANLGVPVVFMFWGLFLAIYTIPIGALIFFGTAEVIFCSILLACLAVYALVVEVLWYLRFREIFNMKVENLSDIDDIDRFKIKRNEAFWNKTWIRRSHIWVVYKEALILLNYCWAFPRGGLKHEDIIPKDEELKPIATAVPVAS